MNQGKTRRKARRSELIGRNFSWSWRSGIYCQAIVKRTNAGRKEEEEREPVRTLGGQSGWMKTERGGKAESGKNGRNGISAPSVNLT
jgi:hypothetical protein